MGTRLIVPSVTSFLLLPFKAMLFSVGVLRTALAIPTVQSPFASVIISWESGWTILFHSLPKASMCMIPRPKRVRLSGNNSTGESVAPIRVTASIQLPLLAARSVLVRTTKGTTLIIESGLKVCRYAVEKAGLDAAITTPPLISGGWCEAIGVVPSVQRVRQSPHLF
jgi:hypothetical protein